MRVLLQRVFLLFPLTLAPAACAFDVDGDAGEDEIGQSSHESISLNGMSLNGMSLNGMSLNGMSLNGMSLNGMSLNGMSLNGSELSGVRTDGQPLSGEALVGTVMKGTLSNGAILGLRVDSAVTLPFPNDDVWAYAVSYAVAGGTWEPMCGTRDGEPVLAIPLTGTWDYRSGVTGGGSWSPSSSSFTLGCRGTALAKCVELGYKPWQTVQGVLLRDHHQACTRMIRADYCGNGKSWTFDGTQINVYDSVGLQADASTAMQVDAEWLPTGARCIHEARALQGKPTCPGMKKEPRCGTFTKGALLIDEYKLPPAPPAPPPPPPSAP
jgi:hypothetical protein